MTTYSLNFKSPTRLNPSNKSPRPDTFDDSMNKNKFDIRFSFLFILRYFIFSKKYKYFMYFIHKIIKYIKYMYFSKNIKYIKYVFHNYDVCVYTEWTKKKYPFPVTFANILIRNNNFETKFCRRVRRSLLRLMAKLHQIISKRIKGNESTSRFLLFKIYNDLNAP